VKPAPFEHHLPATVGDAVTLLSDHGDEAKVMAGGQSLVPLLALRLTRFEHLVDLNGIADLQRITVDDGSLVVGAMTRQAVAERRAEVAAAVPLLHRALPHIGHFQIRNRGTVGGSTAHADPASELPAVALALDAELVAIGPTGARIIPAREFFVSMWTTDLAPDEVLTAVCYPVWTGRCGFAIEELARRHGDFAIAGVACGMQVDDDDRITRAGIALFGMGPTPLRADAAEAALVGGPARAVDARAAAVTAVAATEPNDDIHGPADYRRRLATRLVEVAVTRAVEEATRA
jgi:carbon-monoxide dehydrogenase medium subunit